MEFEEIVRVYNETCEEIIPYLEDEYGLDVDRPEILEDRYPGSAMRYCSGKIHVRSDMMWSKPGLQREFSHELGHAFLDQNTDLNELKESENYDDFLISGVEEFVAEEFRDEGLSQLQGSAFSDGRVLEAASYGLAGVTKDIYDFLNSFLGSIHEDQYCLGRELQSEFNVEQVLEDPRPAHGFLEKRVDESLG